MKPYDSSRIFVISKRIEKSAPKPKYYATKKGSNWFVTLDEPKGNLMGDKFKDKYPVVQLNLNNKKYTGKSSVTLDWIEVPESRQGQGLGEKILNASIYFLKTKGVKEVLFINNNLTFWNHMREKYPNNIELRDDQTGTLFI